MMKKKFIGIRSTAFRTFIAGFALLALLAFVLPQAAQAAGTSGGATIYNTVLVNYTSGTTVQLATANVSVTVNTVSAAVTITSPIGQTVSAGNGAVPVSYNYKVMSNSNGYDTYTPSNQINTATGISAATGASLTPNTAFGLWGGTIIASLAGSKITVPFGTTTAAYSHLVAGTSTIQIGTSTYTVTTITAGSAASTNAGTGALIPEVPDTLTLTLISGTAIVAGTYPAGTAVGEYKTEVAALTTGTPTPLGTTGTYSTTFQVASTVTPVQTATSTAVVTTVVSPVVTITKTVAGTPAPTQTLTYTITVTNSAAGQVSNVVVIDPVPPAYTTYQAGTTTLNGTVVPDVSGNSPLVSPGLTIGTMAASAVDTIVYKVTVN